MRRKDKEEVNVKTIDENANEETLSELTNGKGEDDDE